MLAMNHALVGAAIGSRIENIPAVIALAIVSHLAMDFLPHVDAGTELTKGGVKPVIKLFLAGMDLFASIFIVILILLARPNLNTITVIIGAVSALFLDLLFSVPFCEDQMVKTKPFLYLANFHSKIHEPLRKYQYSLGIPLQIIILGFCIWFLLK